MMDIGYSIHPLFAEPVFTNSVHFTKRPINDDRFVGQPIVENYPINAMRYSPYSEDIAVDAPGYPGKGIYTLNDIILPKMEQIHSIADAYIFHKERRLNHPMAHLRNPEEPFGQLSKCFIDMALYTGDTELYPHCAKRAKRLAQQYCTYADQSPDNREMVKLASEWELLNTVFTGGDANGYLEHLHLLEQQNIHYLERKLRVKMSD